MKILYDSFGFNEICGGVSRYFTQMIMHLPESCDVCIAARVTCNKYLSEKPFSIPFSSNSFYNFLPGISFRGKWRLYSALMRALPPWSRSVECQNKSESAKRIAQCDYDVLHLTGPHFVGDQWKVVRGKKPIVVTIHDLIPEKYGLLRGIREKRAEILAAASHVIAVSSVTKNELSQRYGVRDEKITVIHHGCPSGWPSHTAKEIADKRYILFVGKRDGYKNFTFFICAVAKLLKEHEDLHVICVGCQFTRKELSLLSHLGVANKVKVFEANESSLPSLYANACCLVCPSDDEGFGLTIVEALACGCPVVASDIEVFHEVADDSAMYFGVGDGDDLLNKVMTLIGSLNTRETLGKLGQMRAKEFSWDECARATYDVYRKVLSEAYA